MAEQIYYEDVAEGQEIPTMVKKPTTRQLVKWAGASGDFYEIHYDQAFARSTGLKDVIVHGKLKASFLTQLVTDWIGDQGTVRKMSVRYREMDYPAEEMLCRGKVSAKYERDGERWVECEVWTENPEGKQTTTGTFAVTLPSRAR